MVNHLPYVYFFRITRGTIRIQYGVRWITRSYRINVRIKNTWRKVGRFGRRFVLRYGRKRRSLSFYRGRPRFRVGRRVKVIRRRRYAGKRGRRRRRGSRRRKRRRRRRRRRRRQRRRKRRRRRRRRRRKQRRAIRRRRRRRRRRCVMRFKFRRRWRNLIRRGRKLVFRGRRGSGRVRLEECFVFYRLID